MKNHFCAAAAALAALIAPPAIADTAPSNVTVEVVYSFGGRSLVDGAQPNTGLVLRRENHETSIYGTAFSGGIDREQCEDRGFLGCGIVFRISNGVEVVLHRFTGGLDGGNPTGVIRDDAGNLYGTTKVGGLHNAGTVFKLAPDGTETVLYSFDGHDAGNQPLGGVIADEEGNLYGTTLTGGQSCCGTVFKLEPDGTETVLHSFGYPKDPDGSFPFGRLIRDGEGNLYGVTESGANYHGTVFKITPDGTETILHAFTGDDDGGTASSGLVADAMGALYGAASGISYPGPGVVFKITPDGTFTVLHSFAGDSSPGDLTLEPATGDLYGVTGLDGDHGVGTVYRLAPDGTYATLHSFGGSDGNSPLGVVPDGKGRIYGATFFGGDPLSQGGTIFRFNEP